MKIKVKLNHDALFSGGIISLSGEYEIRPRIIFISDGHATGYEKHSAWDRPRDPANVS